MTASPSPSSALSNPLFVGIDVCADWLDVARSDSAAVVRVPNTPGSITQLVRSLVVDQPARIVVEATGKLERPLLVALLEADLPASLVQPGRVRHFAKALGVDAKTDNLDAKVLVRYAEHARPRTSEKRSANQTELVELLTCRRQLIDARTGHSNQILRTESLFAKKQLKNLVSTLNAKVRKLDARIEQLIESDDDMDITSKILQSVPGVGAVLAATLIGQLTELGRLDHRPLAKLVGVAPLNNDSGDRRGKRHARGGRATVRNVLYMSIVGAVRFNPVLKQMYTRLRDAGRLPKVAMVACMRKLLRILNAMVRDRTTWTPTTQLGA